MKLAEARITVVGLGLMGGSLATNLKGKTAGLTGVDIHPGTRSLAIDRGIVNSVTDDLGSGLEDCDLAVLAVPVRSSLGILSRIGGDLPAPPYLIDLGSTKREVAAAMETLPPAVAPIGGHPLCGKEASGLVAAEPGLFRGRRFVLTPLERTGPEMLALSRELVAALGAEPILMDAERHDRLVAMTSHLPHLTAAALVRCAADLSVHAPEIWNLAAAGFLDSTRLAASDVTMLTDIALTNREPLLEALDAARSELERWSERIQSGEPEAIRAALEPVRDARLELAGERA